MNIIPRSLSPRYALTRALPLPVLCLITLFLGAPTSLRAQTLEHRYSFISDASDSVGGTNWDGTIVAPTTGAAATINHGLNLPGNAGGGNGVSGYVSLPNGIIKGDTSITVECWVEPTSDNTWAEIWDFGSNPNPGVNFALIQYNDRENGTMSVAFTPNGGEIDINTDEPLLASTSTNYIAVTFDNANLTGSLYTNGVLDSSTVFPNSNYSPGNFGGATGTTENTLGNDVYGDPQFGGIIYEVRIWNGVVPQRYISASALLSPSIVLTNLTPTSASLSVASNVVLTGTLQAAVTVQLAATGATNLLATADATNWTTSNTNILKVSSSGLISAVGFGTATVSATVAGIKATSGNITVTPEILEHRYSFVTDASDSVGGTNWDGTLVAPTTGSAATISNGLSLPGNTVGGFGYSGYVSFPSGILLGDSSVTVECWATQNQHTTWSELWDFGNSGSQNFGLIPFSGSGNTRVAITPPAGEIDIDANALPTNSEQYLVVTYNNSTLTGDFYTNGVLDASQSYPSPTYSPGSLGGAIGTTNNMLGNDVYGDQQFDGTVYEFRIWNGAVSPLYVAVSAAAGPSVVVTNVTPLSLTLSVTNNMVGAQLQQAVITGDFDQASGVKVTGAATNWTSSSTNILTVSSSGLITALSGGNATVSATVGGVTVTSEAITVALTAPVITEQPAAPTGILGEAETLSVVAVGGDLTYQWTYDGVAIAGATGSSFTLTNLTFGEAGNYSVLVSNALGFTNSVPAQLAVDNALLVHRYSFVSDASDSVGGPAWAGTIIAPNGGGAATISGGLNLPGNASGGNGVAGYVALPSGILVGNDSITVECWLTQNSQYGWATVWDFANSGSENFEMCPFPDNNDNKLMSAFTPHGNEEDVQTTNTFPTGEEQYVVVTYDNSSWTGNLYLQGLQVGTRVFPDSTYAPAGIGGTAGTDEDWLGNDTYGDAQFDGTIYELRIWNGVVPQRQIAASALLGPTILVTNLTPTTASVTAGPGVVITGTEQATVNVTLEQTGSTNLVATVDATNWVSSNPSVLTVNSRGLISGVGVGTATVSATIAGVATGNSGPITVTPQSLEHRYSFATDASDSVGGSNWDGTIVPPTTGGAATISDGLILPGNAGGGNGVSGYVSFPGGILTNTTSITVECWLTQNQGNGWAEPWDFGNNGNQNFALITDPDDNNGKMEIAFNPNQDNIELDTLTAFPNNVEQYVCLTYNNSTQIGSLYTNGVLDAAQAYPYAIFGPGDFVYAPGSIGGAGGTTENYLGNDVYGDPQFDGTIYEFRIWNGAVSPLYIEVSAAAGSSNVVSNLTPTSLAVTVATSMLAPHTQQATVAGDFAAASGAKVVVTGAATNWTSSDTNVLTVSSTGLITGVGAGSATVSATVDGVTVTSAAITVTPTSVTVGIALSTTNVVLTWSSGVLLEAPTLLGPWTTNSGAVSPYPVPTTNEAEFFKVLVP